MRIELKSVFIIVSLLLISTKLIAQEPEKVFFVKTIPTKIQSKQIYAFQVGYVVNEESDITVEISGGPQKFWAHKAIPVKAGRGILDVNLSVPNAPVLGSGYRVLLSVRARKGNWQTTRTAVDINNLEFVKEATVRAESVSFSPLTPNKLESTGTFKFEIDYSLLADNEAQVSIWKGKSWLASSKRTALPAGNGNVSIIVEMDPPVEGTDYKFMLSFGSQQDFVNKTTKFKENSGIHITAPSKTAEPEVPTKALTIAEINEKSIQLAVNKASDILTLPGSLIYNSIQVINRTGAIVLEAKSTNSIQISNLDQGAYFIITSSGDYFQFVKI